jgi:CMP-N-acetylneuraminic acid synthetase
MDDHPEIGLVYPDYYLVDEHDEVISIERREKISSPDWGLLDIPPHGAGTMFRRHILLELGMYSEEISCQDGYDMWIRFIEHYKADNINLPLFYYRQHKDSMTKDNRKILDTRQQIKRKHAEIKRKRLKASNIKRVAIIPARSYSDVMQRMALQKVAGRPMINYTVDEAIKSDSFTSIVVVSEDDEILKYIKKNYKSVVAIKRPNEFARRNTGIEETVQLVLNTLKQNKGEEYEEGMLLFVESPLRKSKHIMKAIDTLHIFETDNVISLCETNSPYYVRSNKSLKRIGNTEKFRLERKTIYCDNGALCLFKVNNLSKGSIFGEKTGHIIMLREDSINIRSKFDYDLAEFLLSRQNAAGSSP